MQHYTTLHRAIRYYTMLIIQDYTTLYKTIQHYTTLYNNIQDYTTIYNTIQRYTKLYNTIQTIQHYTRV